MFLSIGMLKQKYFLADIFILSAEKQPIKLSWRKIECLPTIFPRKTRIVPLCLKENKKGSYDILIDKTKVIKPLKTE